MYNEHMIYRPDQIVVGYYDAYVRGDKVKCGFPSCRWLKDNNYTEVASFARLTKGIKPHMQRDAEKQISKDLGITLGSFTNNFIDGFKFAGISSSFAVVLDPRGFHVMLPMHWLNEALLKHDCTMSSDHTISGKWSYCFENKRFKTLVHEDDIDCIDIDDCAINKIDNVREHFKLKDLEVGAVYDAYDKNNAKTKTRRYVYIGEHSMHSFITLSDYLWSYAAHSHLTSYSYCFDAKTPWKNAACLKETSSLLKSFKKWPVFILLEDKIEYCSSCVNFNHYCDVIAGDSSNEHSIRYELRDGNIVQDKTLVKRIIKKSDCQDIRVIRQTLPPARKSWSGKPQCYSSPDEYKTLSIDMLVKGFKKMLERIDEEVKKRLELSPVVKPEDVNAWMNKVEDYKTECSKTGKSVLHSLL